MLRIKSEKNKIHMHPGPRGLPLIGSLFQLGNHPHRSLANLSKLHGPVMFMKLGLVPTVIISSAEAAEALLKTHDTDSCSRPALVAWKELSYNFSDVVFSPYGPSWRELRKLLVVKLLCAKKVEGYRSIREEEVERMLLSIISHVSSKKDVNLSELVQRLSNSIICRVAFGRKLEAGGEIEGLFDSALMESSELAIRVFFADYIPLGRWLDKLTGKEAALRKTHREVEIFCQEILENFHEKRVPTDDEETIVDFMLRRLKEHADLTMENVKGVLLNIIFAATDTSAATLETAMAELMRNPKTMMKVQEEVRCVAGKKGKVEESDLPRLNYLKCVIKETLRLHPPAPLLVPRETMGKISINGCDILPKTRIMVNAWAIGRDPTAWERPDEFIPERFVDGRDDFKGQDFKFIPFGAGRRICPGMFFAVVTVELALANLLKAFNWNMPTGLEGGEIDITEGVGIAVRLKTALRLKPTASETFTEFVSQYRDTAP
ncbi:cytochrome P450 71A1-like [Wolffia australiana]